MDLPTIQWTDKGIRIIDQTRLPRSRSYLILKSLSEIEEAIRSLRVRGAPAIGIAAAMGVAWHAGSGPENERERVLSLAREAIECLALTRPTAVNLFWALERMRILLEKVSGQSGPQIIAALRREALEILEEDRRVCRRIGQNGSALIPSRARILTHCNAGSLATADYGTALGVIYAAVEEGKHIEVFADETRPLLQGARLTAWELKERNIPVTLLCDSAAGSLLARGAVDCVITGADRIAANGDTANKVGTYPLSVLARKHGVPFYVAAPLSTVDLSLSSGDVIPIEERSPEEVTHMSGRPVAPEGIDVFNPAFDITPAENISAIITEAGIIRPPFLKGLSTALKQSKRKD